MGREKKKRKVKMRKELEDIRLMVKTHNEATMSRFESLMRRIFGDTNVEVEETRVNDRPGFGRYMAYYHLHDPEGGSRR